MDASRAGIETFFLLNIVQIFRYLSARWGRRPLTGKLLRELDSHT